MVPETVIEDVEFGSISDTLGVITGYGPGGPWLPSGMVRYEVPNQT